MSQSPPQSSFAQVLEGWAKQEKEQDAFSYSRPSIEETNKRTPIVFQNTYIGESPQDCEIRLYGVTEAGASILVRVQDFRHYFFLSAPTRLRNSDTEPLRIYSNDNLNQDPSSPIQSPIYDIQIVQKKPTVNSSTTRRFLKIFVNPRAMTRVKNNDGTCKYKDMFNHSSKALGHDVLYILRFRIDHKIEPMQWLRIPLNKYEAVPMDDRVSNCQMELSTNANVLEAIERPGFAALRILSFDIETDVPNNGQLPTSDNEPVLQIGCSLAIHGQYDPPPYRTIFTVGTCSEIPGAHVVHFETEAEMLTAWKEFFVSADPDIVTGYNILKFDTPYLLGRAKVLDLTRFPYLGRIKDSPQLLPSRTVGLFNSPEYDGRLLLDMMRQMRFLEDPVSTPEPGWFKLDDVCSRILGERKEGVSVAEIPKLQRGGPDDRRRLATYCLKDTYLPLRLMSHLNCIAKETERAKALRLPMNFTRKFDSELNRLSNTVKRGLEAVNGGSVQ